MSRLGLVAALVLAACSGEKKKEPAPAPADPVAEVAPAAPGTPVELTRGETYRRSRTLTISGGTLIHASRDGGLHQTSLTDGTSIPRGRSPELRQIRWLLGAEDALFAIDHDGGLYRLDAAGKRSLIGTTGVHTDAQAAAIDGGVVYTIDTTGAWWATDTTTGAHTPLPLAKRPQVKLLRAGGGNLLVVDDKGVAYLIRPRSRDERQLGNWKQTLGAAFAGGLLYRVDHRGGLLSVDLGTGRETLLGKPEHLELRWLGASGDLLVGVYADGGVYRIHTK